MTIKDAIALAKYKIVDANSVIASNEGTEILSNVNLLLQAGFNLMDSYEESLNKMDDQQQGRLR